MGVVYRARDRRLGRLVALKVLPPEKVADTERRRRFVHEAKAASALNHPNIVTIHDIDTTDGVTFMVMEYVQGTTLDRLIRERPPRFDALREGVQIADALSAAHGAGIVHRDVKPANIMVTDSGLVKILDFGLAKLNAPDASDAPDFLPPSDEGLILGTVAYMSPEQAEGKDVDHRSDIFSLGAVLYEMATGRRAFQGETHVSTLRAILGRDPEPVRQLAAAAPRELEEVIGRCLEKDRERRFQRASEVKAALERLAADSVSGALVVPAGGRRRDRRWRIAWAAGTLATAAALGLGGWAAISRERVQPRPVLSGLTIAPGSQLEPALSPDGTQVAFLWNGDIHVRAVDGAAPRRLTSNPALESAPAWSPDARHIAFLRRAASGTEVLLVPSAGGEERRVVLSNTNCGTTLAKLYCGPSWSPDGRYLGVVDRESPRAPTSIFLVDVGTGEHRKLTTPPPEFEDGLCAFSPDGRSLAFSRRPGPWPLSDLYVLRLENGFSPAGDPVRITRDNSFIWGFDWAADGRSLVFASSRGGVDSLWRVASSGGEPEGLPVGGSDAFWPSVSRTGDRLVYHYGRANTHLWRVAAPGAGPASERASPPRRISYSPRWDQQPSLSPDGQRVAWSSTSSGSHQIWVSSSGGEKPRQLTALAAPGADMPRWSPDGRHIVFRGFQPGPEPDLYVVPSDGGSPRRLTTGALRLSQPSWAREGKWLYFSSAADGVVSVWKVRAAGGPSTLVARPGRWPMPSRDGLTVYYAGPEQGVWRRPAEGGGAALLLSEHGRPPLCESTDGAFVYFSGTTAGIWKVAAAGGEAARVSDAGERARWTSSEKGIYVLDPDAVGGPAIEFIPFDGTKGGITRLGGEPDDYEEPSATTSSALAASPDGRWLVFLRKDPIDRKIMLVENFR